MAKYKYTKERMAQIIGEASMCWSEIPKGVFDTQKANDLVEEIMGHIEHPLEDPETEEAKDK